MDHAIHSLNLEFEKAVRALVLHMPPSDENSRKPALFHAIRVGVYLYEKKYPRDIVLAGVLHDALEWSEITEEMIREEFGVSVLKLVRACTKDDSIKDPLEKINELIKRCAESGQDALIVKTADVIDSFKYYAGTNNEAELLYCTRNAAAIIQYKPESFTDGIFNELRNWQKGGMQ
ncbi:MAG: HD domain-containing protein [Candidatus Uhrbacteria bacterium]|nr:HD domain-containing protein [Candidatus Uhrbacteria bacterium]